MKRYREHPDMPVGQTPKIPDAAGEPACPVYKEVHAEGRVPHTERKKMSETRDFILTKYGLSEDNCIIFPSPERGRRIRAFTILEHRTDPKKRYYAEGHTAHALLLDTILERFNPAQTAHNHLEILEKEGEFEKQWITRKGFLDPAQDGFQAFPESRSSLLGQLKQHAQINGLSTDQLENLDEEHIPNWFLSGDSSSESPLEEIKKPTEE